MRGDDDALDQEPLGDLDRHVEESSRVAADVENQHFHAGRLQSLRRLVQLLQCGFLKAEKLDIADAQVLVEETRLRDAGHVQHFAGKLAWAPLAGDLQLDAAAWFTL